MEASSLRYDKKWQNWWICNIHVRSQEEENIKFNITDVKSIFDGFKNWRQTDVTVEPGVVKPAGITQIKVA